MDHSPQHSEHATQTAGFDPKKRTANRLVFWGFLGIAAYYLLTEHRAHLVAGLSWLPWLLLFACPFMHLFMHHGHGGHGGHDSKETEAADVSPPATPTTDVAAGANPDRPHSHGGKPS